MGIHAKSLNQLAHELEARRWAAQEAQQPQPTSASIAASDLAKELAEFQKFVAGLCSPAQEVAKPGDSELPVPAEREMTPAPAFYMDTTLGTRTRPAEAAQVRKGEAEVRFYSAFASRADITGES